MFGIAYERFFKFIKNREERKKSGSGFQPRKVPDNLVNDLVSFIESLRKEEKTDNKKKTKFATFEDVKNVEHLYRKYKDYCLNKELNIIGKFDTFKKYFRRKYPSTVLKFKIIRKRKLSEQESEDSSSISSSNNSK